MSKLVVCKTCGNDDLTEVSEGILKCKYCRHLTEKPKENADLMERAHNLRFNSKDFDEAAKIYEEVIRLTPNEAEAYWGRVLCRFGIEYVKDTNGEYLPTCHRTIQSSILDDADYLMAVNKASGDMKAYYTEQAKLIDTYQTNIKVISAKEKPYDVFISFKATDNGKPTEDSLIAQEIYYYLTKNLGLKVFFSNITLKDKAGQEYEPIIFAALSSATVMVLVGTKNEYINATWVKNEWSRYIGMVADAKKQNKSKYIVTAIKGMRPEELPSALASYQAVNIGELGAKEKLCSNIDSLIGDLRVAKSSKSSGGSIDANDMLAAEAANLSKLGLQQVELGNIDKANEYFDKALEKKADTALANWGKLLISQNVKNDDELAQKPIQLGEHAYCKLALENADADERIRFQNVITSCEDRFKRADAKTRHTSEYKIALGKLQYVFSRAKKGGKETLDETTDKLISEYVEANDSYTKAKNTQSGAQGNRMITTFFGVVFIIIGVIISLFAGWTSVASIIFFALGILLVVLRIAKGAKYKSKIAELENEKDRYSKRYNEAEKKLVLRSAELMAELNAKFPDVDDKEPNYALASDCLLMWSSYLSECLGVDKAEVERRDKSKNSARIDLQYNYSHSIIDFEIPKAQEGTAHIYAISLSTAANNILENELGLVRWKFSKTVELPYYIGLNIPIEKAEKIVDALNANYCKCELRYE